jgi:peptidyl-prolyl cis-trans isomerase SurA
MKFLLSATIILASPLIAAPVPLLRTAATVNGKMITTREVEQQLAPTVSMLLAKYPRRGDKFREAFVEARNEVLDELIEHKLVLSSLEEKNLQIPEYLVKQDVERFIRINFSGNQDEFRKYLKSIRMTRREFEKSQQEKILVQSFKRQQFKDVAPATDSEIKERYQKRSSDLRDRSKDVITFRKIYIPSIDQDNPVATQEDQLALAEKLAAEVKGGADFSSVAKSHSAGAFADKGGLWEDTLRSDLEVGFADIVFDSPEGTIVGPIKDRVGFTIVQVVKISTGPLPPFDAEMRERMRSEVEIEKRSGRYDEWIKMLKRNAIIRRNT